MFVPPKQQQQDALIVVIDHNRIYGGFAVDPCLSFNIEAVDMTDGIIHNFLSLQQAIEQINLQDHSEQSSLPLILVVSREQPLLQEISQHFFLNTGFKTIGLIYRDTALLFYQSRQTCLIVDFKSRAISLLLSIDGVTDDMIVIQRSTTIEERIEKALGKNKHKNDDSKSQDPDIAIIRDKIAHHFDNEVLAYALRDSALLKDFYTGTDMWALHCAVKCPGTVLEQIGRLIQKQQQLRPGQQLFIVLTGECSRIPGLERWISGRIAQMPRGAACKVVAAGDRGAAEFLGAAAAVQAAPEQLLFTELDQWDSQVGRAIFH